MTVYATPEDLAAYTGTTAPADAERLLARASEAVASSVLAPVQVDLVTGLPARPAVREALRLATCAQAEQWAEVGEDNDIAGYPRQTSVSVQGSSTTHRPAVLAPRAARYLAALRLHIPAGA